LKDVEDDDEAVQEKFNNVVGKEFISKIVSADMANIFNIFWIMSKLVCVDMADIFSLV
jgi:hypothetical protein